MRVPDPQQWLSRFRDLGLTTIVPVLEEELLAPASSVPRAAELARSSLSLPIYPGVADESVETIVQELLN
jgi:dTDP-4-amino-4,6-dideoxygalactose transaminase